MASPTRNIQPNNLFWQNFNANRASIVIFLVALFYEKFLHKEKNFKFPPKKLFFLHKYSVCGKVKVQYLYELPMSSPPTPRCNIKSDWLEVVYTMKARSRSTLYIPDNGNYCEKLPHNCLQNVIVPGVQVSTYFTYNQFLFVVTVIYNIFVNISLIYMVWCIILHNNIQTETSNLHIDNVERRKNKATNEILLTNVATGHIPNKFFVKRTTNWCIPCNTFHEDIVPLQNTTKADVHYKTSSSLNCLDTNKSARVYLKCFKKNNNWLFRVHIRKL